MMPGVRDQAADSMASAARAEGSVGFRTACWSDPARRTRKARAAKSAPSQTALSSPGSLSAPRSTAPAGSKDPGDGGEPEARQVSGAVPASHAPSGGLLHRRPGGAGREPAQPGGCGPTRSRPCLEAKPSHPSRTSRSPPSGGGVGVPYEGQSIEARLRAESANRGRRWVIDPTSSLVGRSIRFGGRSANGGASAFRSTRRDGRLMGAASETGWLQAARRAGA